ncbi:hypothetical protein J7S33_19215, partial [Saccharothrix algeriensis]
MSGSAMERLQAKAAELQSRLGGISTGLRGLQLGPSALGPIGMFTVSGLNSSTTNSVEQVDRAATTFGNVQAGLRATQQTHVLTDANSSKEFGRIIPYSGALGPPGGPSGGPSG